MRTARGIVVKAPAGAAHRWAVEIAEGETYLPEAPTRPVAEGESVLIEFVPGDQFCRLRESPDHDAESHPA